MKNLTNIIFFCPTWGMAAGPLDKKLQMIKSAGYDGLEFGLCSFNEKAEIVRQAAKDSGLLLLAQECEAKGNDFVSYKKDFIEQLKLLMEFQPVSINSQTGKDYFTLGENITLIQEAIAIEKEYGISITHETHRGKGLFSSKITHQVTEILPEVKLTGDFSHFCVVSESYLEEQEFIIADLIPHVSHIHARVGHTQGPQVIDPRLPEWSYAFERHLSWWDNIITFQRNKSEVEEYFPITVEFGPPPYMPSTSGQSHHKEQWELNLFMKDFLHKRYN